MRFNNRSNLAGQHAFLSASQYAWHNYDVEKLDRVYATQRATIKATELHELAAMLIKHRVRLPDTSKTLNQYVNDAIGYRMSPEVVLFYSGNAFGTADAISFWSNVLRIHDLKNGLGKTSFKQLKTYAAFFCLEYNKSPFDIDEIIMRIYQGNGIREEIASPEEIVRLMEHIKMLDRRLSELRLEN